MLRRRVRGRWSDGGNAEFFVFVEVRRKCEWKRVLVAVERDDAGAWDFRVQAIVRRRAGVLGGKYRWQVQLPISVTYKSATEGRTDNLLLTLIIERVSALENPNGVGIEQWIAEQK